MKLPCKNCICLAICKSKIDDFISAIISLYALRAECVLLTDPENKLSKKQYLLLMEAIKETFDKK